MTANYKLEVYCPDFPDYYIQLHSATFSTTIRYSTCRHHGGIMEGMMGGNAWAITGDIGKPSSISSGSGRLADDHGRYHVGSFQIKKLNSHLS